MKKNFNVEKKKIENNEVTHHGLKMAKYSIQALICLGLSIFGLGAFGGAPQMFPKTLGLAGTGLSIKNLVQEYKSIVQEKQQKNKDTKGKKRK